jgi:hypothetical protein
MGEVRHRIDKSLPLDYILKTKTKTKLHGLSPRANLPTERPQLVGEVTANFCGKRVPRGQRDGSLRPYYRFLDRSRYFSVK